MRFFGWIAGLAVLAAVLIAGAIGYNIGIGTNIAASGAAPVVVPAYGYGWGFGFGHIFGFFFFLLILFVIFGAIRRAAWGGHHRYGAMGRGYGYGPGGWGRHAVDDQFDRWHRRAHGETDEESRTPPTAAPS